MFSISPPTIVSPSLYTTDYFFQDLLKVMTSLQLYLSKINNIIIFSKESLAEASATSANIYIPPQQLAHA